ncbi:MAG TPA: hypothetical protein V6D03_16515 [Candidatus Caenarcaniphilales bacterium]
MATNQANRFGDVLPVDFDCVVAGNSAQKIWGYPCHGSRFNTQSGSTNTDFAPVDPQGIFNWRRSACEGDSRNTAPINHH